MPLSRLNKINWGIIGSLALGAGAFFWLYKELLDIRYIDWLVNMGQDPLQTYLGWELYRHSPWSFPLGRIANLAYPVGVPLAFTDSIPLLAIFFKLFRQWLPVPFQFIGIWQMICFALQGLFGYLLSERFLKRRGLAVIGSVFFILAPIMLFRLEGHFSLGAHWLLLWALWLALEPTGKIQTGHWTAVIAVSLFVHPYLFLMNGALFITDLVRRTRVIRTLSLKKALLLLAAEAILALALAQTVGLFSIGNSAAPGFGVYSLDLNSLVNPDGYSSTLPDLPVRRPNEGFNYLGLGIILLGLSSLYKFATVWPRKKNWRIIFSNYWPVILTLLAFTAVAVSHIVSLNGKEILALPLPDFWRERVFGVVRSSGRLFWPAYYLIFLGSFFMVKRLRPALAAAILVAALFVQIYDLNGKLRQIDDNYQDIKWDNPLQSPFWKEAAEKYKRVSFIPVFIYGRHEPVALFASQQGLAMNTGMIIRNGALANKERLDEERRLLEAGAVDEKTLYVFRHESEARQIISPENPAGLFLTTVDGYAVLAP